MSLLLPFMVQSADNIKAAEFGDPPSKKAVNEHFFKIRKTNKKFIEGNGTPGGTPGGTPAATPMKKARATPVKKNKNEPKTPTSKRKRKELGGLSDDDEEVDAVAVPKTELNGLDGANSDGGAARESPAKRARAAVKYEESAGEDADLSGSDFHIDEA